jgi:sugar lactone lactonase YvrE
MTSPLEIAQPAQALLGEGPTWDPVTGRLLWVDILGSEVHRLDPVTGTDLVLRTPQHVGAAKPRLGGGLVVNLRDGVALYPPDDHPGDERPSEPGSSPGHALDPRTGDEPSNGTGEGPGGTPDASTGGTAGQGRGGNPDTSTSDKLGGGTSEGRGDRPGSSAGEGPGGNPDANTGRGRSDAGTDDPGGSLTWLVRWPREGCRGNDAAVDAQGRLWVGTMRYDEAAGGGRLRRVDGDGQVVDVLEDVTVSNGTGWSPDGRRMYYVDSPTRRVDVFDVDPSTGLVSGRRPFVTLDARTRGWPDGLCVDAYGCVWLALWAGGAVRRYTPTARLDRVIELPTTNTTACTFGGPRHTDLYITTARDSLDEATLAAEPHAGDVFVLTDAGDGLPGHAFAG